jgi:DNA-binding NtrC family response regulator
VINLNLPSLSQRREDIPLLIDHLTAKLNRIQGKGCKRKWDSNKVQSCDRKGAGCRTEMLGLIPQMPF